MPLLLSQRKINYLKGQRGERIAAFYLRLKGYKVLKHRFKTPVGEIDLLVLKDKILVAVEVKRRDTHEKALISVASFQQRRIEKALLYYLIGKPSPLNLRFDVVLISPWKWPCHIQGAWISQQ